MDDPWRNKETSWVNLQPQMKILCGAMRSPQTRRPSRNSRSSRRSFFHMTGNENSLNLTVTFGEHAILELNQRVINWGKRGHWSFSERLSYHEQQKPCLGGSLFTIEVPMYRMLGGTAFAHC